MYLNQLLNFYNFFPVFKRPKNSISLLNYSILITALNIFQVTFSHKKFELCQCALLDSDFKYCNGKSIEILCFSEECFAKRISMLSRQQFNGCWLGWGFKNPRQTFWSYLWPSFPSKLFQIAQNSHMVKFYFEKNFKFPSSFQMAFSFLHFPFLFPFNIFPFHGENVCHIYRIFSLMWWKYYNLF